MNFYNQVLDKKGLKRIVSWFIENYGPTRTSLLLDDFKYIGFHYAGKAGLSLGFDDLRIPATKKVLLTAAQKQVQECEKTYLMGRITAFERYQKLIDIWTTTSEKLKDEVIQNFQKIQGGPLASPLYMMAFSGARGNISQVRQLVGMRGLMSDSGGGIIDFPIRSNFREGLSVTEYVISCYGARKGLIDTALRTADSGYLTRRLVDVAHGIIIREIDCGTSESVFIKISDKKNIIGRVLAETIHERIPPIWKNQEISQNLALELKTFKGSKASIQVRSPLTCLSQSVCQLCYGWNLAQGRLVALGDAVGILAAQSIGEPGTQLTMRTFHTGGIFSTEVEDKIYSPSGGKIYLQRSIKTQQNEDRGGQSAQNSSKQSFETWRSSRSSFETEEESFVPSFQLQTLSSIASSGCKIRSVHGQTAFFFFEPIQLKIEDQNFKDGIPHLPKLNSILQLPAQSILFITPGKTIFKNTLCAEISRIKQPPAKTDEINLDRQGSKRSFEEISSENQSEKRDDSRLAQKKVFSEIQGEVLETSCTDVRNFTKLKFGEHPSQGGIGDNFINQNSGQSTIAEFGARNRTRNSRNSKRRLVLAGEPFSFQRNKNNQTKQATIKKRFSNAELTLGRSSLQPVGEPRNAGNAKWVSQLPFRVGDIVFWKGKRKLSEENSLMVVLPPLENKEINWSKGSGNKTQSYKGVAYPFLNFDQPFSEKARCHRKPAAKLKTSFEIRKINLEKKFIHENLAFAGLVLEFRQQKEQKTNLLNQSNLTLLKTNSNLSQLGKILQPYTFFTGLPPAMNVPTQIIRKRLTKLILRRVQPYLGGQLKGPESQSVQNSRFEDQKTESLKMRTAALWTGGELSRMAKLSNSDKAIIAAPQVNQRSAPQPFGSKTIFEKQRTRYVNERDLLFQLVLPISDSAGSGDIVQGLPKIEQLFEARSSSENSSKHLSDKSEKNRELMNLSNQKTKLKRTENKVADAVTLGNGISTVSRVPTFDEPRQLSPQTYDSSVSFLKKNELRDLQKRLIQEIQSVYNSQGVEIADKHLEIIVRQMTSRVRILEKGNTPFYPDDIVEAFGSNALISKEQKFPSREKTSKQSFETSRPSGSSSELGEKLYASGEQVENQSTIVLGEEKSGLSYEWILLGITKVALLSTTESYISAASFQETKRVLMTAALQSRVDFFEGLKENVIVGRIIPAGTGYTK